jgi:CheY-like chemotaxis protein
MDIRMPVMDGIQATKLIRQTGKNKHTPIIAVTANNQPIEVKRYLEIGMLDCVGKPVSLQRLRIVLETYILSETKNKIESIPKKTYSRNTEINNLFPPLNKEKSRSKKDISSKISSSIGGKKFQQQNKAIPLKKKRTSKPSQKAIPSVEKETNKSPQQAETIFPSTDDSLQPQFFPKENKKELKGKSLLVEELPIFDVEQAKRIAINNLHILRKIIDKFSQDTPKQLEKLQTALQANNQKEMERLAHSLKGSARSVGALRLGEVAFIAETAANQGDLSQIEQLLSTLIEELGQLEGVWKKTEWETLL